MITLSELQMKEVILLKEGKRLGHIVDLEIDVDTGLITEIIILDRQEKATFFQKPGERAIPWTQIKTIGEDMILIEDTEIHQISFSEDKIE